MRVVYEYKHSKGDMAFTNFTIKNAKDKNKNIEFFYRPIPSALLRLSGVLIV